MSQLGNFATRRGPIVEADADNPEYILFNKATFARGTLHLVLAGMSVTLCGRAGATIGTEVVLFRGKEWKKLCGKCRPIAEAMVMNCASSPYPPST